VVSEKRQLFLRLVNNKGFKDNGMTKDGSYAIGTSTTLESNKSLAELLASIMAPATPVCFWTTQKHLTVKRTMGSVT